LRGGTPFGDGGRPLQPNGNGRCKGSVQKGPRTENRGGGGADIKKIDLLAEGSALCLGKKKEEERWSRCLTRGGDGTDDSSSPRRQGGGTDRKRKKKNHPRTRERGVTPLGEEWNKHQVGDKSGSPRGMKQGLGKRFRREGA